MLSIVFYYTFRKNERSLQIPKGTLESTYLFLKILRRSKLFLLCTITVESSFPISLQVQNLCKSYSGKVPLGVVEDPMNFKERVSKAPVLDYPHFSKPFVLYGDGCDVGIGAAVMQEQDAHLKIIRYLSRTLNPTERNHFDSKREFLAIVHASTSLKHCLLRASFTCMTDCRAVTPMREKAIFNSRIMNLLLLLHQFAFGINCVQGSEKPSDCLSRLDMSDLEKQSLDY
jgi:hypothetical protein